MHCAQVFVSETVHTLQFDDELFLHNQISQVFAHVLPLVANQKVANRKRNLSLGAYTAQGQLADQGALINFLQKSRSQNIGNLEGGANHRLRQIRFPSVSIRGLSPIGSPKEAKLSRRRRRILATDGHGFQVSSYFPT